MTGAARASSRPTQPPHEHGRQHRLHFTSGKPRHAAGTGKPRLQTLTAQLSPPGPGPLVMPGRDSLHTPFPLLPFAGARTCPGHHLVSNWGTQGSFPSLPRGQTCPERTLAPSCFPFPTGRLGEAGSAPGSTDEDAEPGSSVAVRDFQPRSPASILNEAGRQRQKREEEKARRVIRGRRRDEPVPPVVAAHQPWPPPPLLGGQGGRRTLHTAGTGQCAVFNGPTRKSSPQVAFPVLECVCRGDGG